MHLIPLPLVAFIALIGYLGFVAGYWLASLEKEEKNG